MRAVRSKQSMIRSIMLNGSCYIISCSQYVHYPFLFCSHPTGSSGRRGSYIAVRQRAQFLQVSITGVWALHSHAAHVAYCLLGITRPTRILFCTKSSRRVLIHRALHNNPDKYALRKSGLPSRHFALMPVVSGGRAFLRSTRGKRLKSPGKAKA